MYCELSLTGIVKSIKASGFAEYGSEYEKYVTLDSLQLRNLAKHLMSVM